LSNQLPTIPSALQPYLFPLLSAFSLIIIVHYSIPSQNISGHLVCPLTAGARSNILSDLLDRAAGKSGGIYEESQKERRLLLSGLRVSEWGVDDTPVAIHLSIDRQSRNHNFDDGQVLLIQYLVNSFD
jgi:hypothetical protein